MQIEFKNCGKSYQRQWLFRNLDCTFSEGEKWAFLGANGSGKSTLALLLMAQVWPTEGQVSWFHTTKTIDPHSVFSHLSLASPAMELPEEFSVNEIIAMQARSKPFRIADVEEQMAALCAFSAQTMKKPLANFSSGMKQRVKLCLAAFADTPVVILDEPLTNLDKAGEIVFRELIEKHCENRMLVIASNRPDEYVHCTRFLKLEPDRSVTID